MTAASPLCSVMPLIKQPGTYGSPRRNLAVVPSLDRPPETEPPYDDENIPHLHTVPIYDPLPCQPAPRQFIRELDFFDAQPTPRRDLPDPRLWSRQLIQAFIEAVTGHRSVCQLREWTSQTVFMSVVHATENPERLTRANKQPHIHSIRVSEPADGVAEICAVIRSGTRHLALAARLEGLDGRWQCVALTLG